MNLSTEQLWDIAWMGWYLFLPFMATLYLTKFTGLNFWQSAGIVLSATLLKEMGDQLYSMGYFGVPRSTHWFLDSRGWQLLDVGTCLVSITISFPLRSKK